MELMIPEHSRRLIEYAAKLRGKSLEEFATDALVEKAEAVLYEGGDQVRVLNERDALRFLEILETQEPNQALLDAAKRHLGDG